MIIYNHRNKIKKNKRGGSKKMTNKELLERILDEGYIINKNIQKSILNATPEKAMKYATKYHIVDNRSDEEIELVDVVVPRYRELHHKLAILSQTNETHDVAMSGILEEDEQSSEIAAIWAEVKELENRIRELCGTDYLRAEYLLKIYF